VSLIVFADFSCPECYLASRRVAVLEDLLLPGERLPWTDPPVLARTEAAAQWGELGGPELPVLLVGGATLHGLDAVRRLGKEIAYVQAALEPSTPPPVSGAAVRPGPAWTSRVGDPWRSDYLLAGS